MRVLFLTVNLGCGGAEKVLVNLANELAGRGHDITIRSVIDQGENKNRISPSVKYEFVFHKYFRGVNYLYKLPSAIIYRIICNGKYDIVIPYLHGMLTRVVSYAPIDQKTMAWLHTDMRKSIFMNTLVREKKVEECFKNYNRIVAVADSVKDSFIETTGIKDNVITLYNTFDVDEIIEKSKEQCDGFQNTIKLVSIGKLEKVKGYERLLVAFNNLVHNDNLNLSLVIVGEGSERKSLETYVQKNKLQDRVAFPGYDANPYKYLSISDLFICSSYSEGFSSVVAESLILGVPVVSTDVSGAKELLGDSEYGIIVGNSEQGIYDGIKKALSELHTLSEKAKQRGKKFSVDQTVGAVERVMEELM